MAKRRVDAFGSRFRAKREALGISRAEAARRVGVHVTNLMGWEDERKLPKNPNTYVAARDLLQVDGWWLMTGEGAP
jgi:DNA-binding transcriptional regulator YiaG